MFTTNNMQYRSLGNTGLKVSAIGFGNSVNSSQDRVEIDDALIHKCLQSGINFFDTSERYNDGQAEKALGRALKKSKVDRQDVVISTKFFTYGNNVNTVYNLNRKHVVESIDASLGRLGLDYVDVVFAHGFDEKSSIEEVCRGFNKIIEDGKAFYWATSNWDAASVYEAFGVCDRLGLHRPVADQLQYNMLVRKDFEVEFETLFDKHHYGATTWSPLAGGFLTGKYLDGVIPQGSRLHSPAWLTADIMKQYFYVPHNNPKTIGALRQLQTISKEMGGTLAQLALAWVLRNPNVSTAIAGASRVEQIEEAVKSLELLKKWTPQLDKKINKILDTTPTPKFNWNDYSAGTPRRPADN